MKLPGTILPTSRSLALNKRHHANTEREKRKVGEKLLGHLPTRQEAGETQYLDGPNRYAIINQSLRVQWFEKRADGYWYAVK